MLFQTIPAIDEFLDVDNVTGWDVTTGIGIFVVAVAAAALLRRYTKQWLESAQNLDEALAAAIASGIGYAALLSGFLLALPYFGVDTRPVMLLILIGGLLLFFGGRALMENFSAGIILHVRSPYGVGDLIRHENHLGVVKDIDSRATVLLTADGEIVRIANTVILREPIINLSREGVRRSTVDIGVAYGTDLDHTVAVLTEAMKGLDAVLLEPPALIGVAEFDDSAVRVQVMYWHEPSMTDEIIARDQALRSIARALTHEGIVIAFPQRDIWVRTVPEVRHPTEETQ